jgi:hypothetical protein
MLVITGDISTALAVDATNTRAAIKELEILK